MTFTFKKHFFYFFIIFFIVSLSAEARLRVISTLPIFDGLVSVLAGDRVDHKSLAQPSQDPHFVDAKPSFVSELARADLLIDGGLGLEDGWLPLLVRQAANPKIQPGATGRVHLSYGLKILEVPQSTANRAQGDIHPQGNPHIWHDPRNILIMAATLCEAISRSDPDGRAFYSAHLKSFQSRLGTAISMWSADLKPLAGTTIVTYHRSLIYFAAYSDIRVLETIEPLPGIPPSSARLVELAGLIRNGKVRVILGEDWYPAKDGKFLSEKTGVPYRSVPELGEDAIAGFDEIVRILKSP